MGGWTPEEKHAWYVANRERILRESSDRYWADGHARIKGVCWGAWRGALPEHRRRAHQLWTKYRLTWDRYQAMLEQQFNVCAACSQPFGSKGPVVDHDHSCCNGQFSCGMCIRALLCEGCNTAEGSLGGDPGRARALALYMEVV